MPGGSVQYRGPVVADNWVLWFFTIVDIEIDIRKQKEPIEHAPLANVRVAFALFGQVGLSVALPLVAGAMIGAYLDAQWHTKPMATLIGLGIGFIISIVSFMGTVAQFMKRSK